MHSLLIKLEEGISWIKEMDRLVASLELPIKMAEYANLDDECPECGAPGCQWIGTRLESEFSRLAWTLSWDPPNRESGFDLCVDLRVNYLVQSVSLEVSFVCTIEDDGFSYGCSDSLHKDGLIADPLAVFSRQIGLWQLLPSAHRGKPIIDPLAEFRKDTLAITMWYADYIRANK